MKTTLQQAPQAPITGLDLLEKQAGYDKWNAAFRHEIDCLDGRRLDGYSKTLACSEKQDKLAVLQGVVERIWFKSNYRGKAKAMRIYWQNGPIRKEHKLLLTLTPQDFHPEPELLVYAALTKWLGQMFNRQASFSTMPKNLGQLFNVEEQAKLMEAERTHELQSAQIFNPVLAKNPLEEAPIWPSREEFWHYCTILKKQGTRPNGAIDQFFRNMTRKYPKYA